MVEQAKQAGLIFFELADQARLPEINEPLFAELHAPVEIVPVLNRDDLGKGLGTSSS
jgi:hypothetical protein